MPIVREGIEQTLFTGRNTWSGVGCVITGIERRFFVNREKLGLLSMENIGKFPNVPIQWMALVSFVVTRSNWSITIGMMETL
jgi:hypothetical protein